MFFIFLLTNVLYKGYYKKSVKWGKKQQQKIMKVVRCFVNKGTLKHYQLIRLK